MTRNSISISIRTAIAAFLLLALTTLSLPAVPLQTLHGHVPSALKSLAPTGHLSTANELKLAIGLPLQNTSALSHLLEQLYNPTSPNYRHYLTPAQFTEQFGPTEEDYQALITFAKANHLRVTATHPNRMLLDVSGSVSDVEHALHVTLLTYQHPTEKRSLFAPGNEPSLDLNVPVLHISGLDNFVLPHPASHKMAFTQATPAVGSGPGGAYMGNDFRNAYAPGVTLTGNGQNIGLLQFDSGFYQSDITAYETQAGLPNVPVQPVLLDGYDGGPGQGNDEVSLDIEMVISMAPGVSQIYVFEGSDTDDILNAMAANNQIKQLSASWSYPIDATTIQIFQQFAAQGQSFFNASGDDDAWVGSIPTPCDNPYITIVGGTTLDMNGNGTSFNSEIVWNWGTEHGRDGIGTGGGISTTYTIPNWQTNISMAANQGSTTMRNIPDVAMTADNVWVIYGGGGTGAFGGTSCATPLWAAFAALVNQQAAASGQPPIGFINPAVYAIASGPNYTSCFHDITSGNNTWSGSPNKFYAAPGYDLCTGLGTPTGQNLINALANPEPLLIAPATGLAFVGGVGGPFFPTTSQNYSLTNLGTNTLTWTLSNTSVWLNVSSTGGTLVAAGPASVVTVSLNNTASNLVVGTYTATLWFTNINDNFGQSRAFTLSVIAPPSITQQPTNEAVLEGATATFNVQTTGGLPLTYQWQFNGTNLTDGGNISGSSATNLTISNVSAANVGNYAVIVTNFADSVTSFNATLTIIPSAPVIVLQPTNQTVGEDSTVNFAVQVVGTKPYSYQWSFNGTNLINATNALLTLTDVQLTSAGNYTVLVTNSLGSVLSSNAILTVTPCDPPPSGLVAWWQGEGNALDIFGGNNGTLVNGTGFTNGEVGTAFYLNGINNYVLANPSAPSSLDVGQGSGLTFEEWINPNTVSQEELLLEYERALGTSSGSDVGVLLAIHANLPGSGLYAGLADTSGGAHIFTSPGNVLTAGLWQHIAMTYDKSSGLAALYINGVAVTITNFGSFVPQTSFTNLVLGARTTFGSAANPVVPYSGAMDELSLYNRALSSNEIAAIYQVGSSGKCFTPTPPLITSQPTNQTVPVGGTATFSVTASGTLPLGYQWSFNGTNISGATNTTLILNNVQLGQSGNYSVTVSNAYGSTNSAGAVLTVYGLPPVIISQPTSQTVFVGGTAIFNVAVSGTPAFAYQWSFDGTNIANATNAALTLNDVQLNRSGNYSVLITNLFGSTNSAIAILTVNPLPPCDPPPSGIVAWWRAEGNALDIIGGNNGTLMNGTGFTNGEVGAAFYLNGVNNYVLANPSAPSNLDVGQGSGLTFEEWINPNTVGQEELLMEYERALGTSSGSDVGILLAIHANMPGSGLYAGLADTSGGAHIFTSPANILNAGLWQHIAMTYDKTSGLAALYINGVAVTVTNVGIFTPQTSFTNIILGARTTFGSAASPVVPYSGEMDEVSLYNRALSSNEIATIYQVGGGGKCFTPTLPRIVSQPTNQTVLVGGTAMFAVTASGTLPLGYQWSFNGTNISGATNVVLTLNSAQLGQSGNYSVTVSNAYGSTNSASAILTVYGLPPVITSQPAGQTIYVGSTATFSVTVSGTPPFAYQWSFDGTNIANATNAALTLNDVQLNQSGNYSVLITNLFGSTNSAIAILTVNPLPPCDPPPSGIVAWWAAESNALDSVDGNNGTLMNGTGFTNGEVGTAFYLNGGNNYVLANPSAPSNLDVGQGSGLTFEEWIKPNTVSQEELLMEYERALGTSSGSDVGIGMAIHAASPGGILYAYLPDTIGGNHIFTSPVNLLTVGVWQHIAMTYDKASGLASLYFNGAIVTQINFGSFTPLTSFTNIILGARTTFGSAANPVVPYSGAMDEASLYNRALSSNEIATIYQVGSLGKCPLPPTIFSQPASQSVSPNGTATFQVVAGGTPALKYQWSFNGTNLINATNAVLTLATVQFTNAGSYSVQISNGSGSTNSATAILTVQAAPVITSQPPLVTVVPAGNTVNFTVNATGTPPLNYQWRFNTVSITGATNTTLMLTNVQFTNSGQYSVIVTNLYGSATSSNALLIVQSPPVVTLNPTNITAKVGDTVTFSSTATGSPTLSYQWTLNDPANPLPGATAATLILTNVQLANAGIYAVIVTNSFGSTISSNATLTVIDTLDHFTWNALPTPWFVNTPLGVTIQAMDSINQVFTNFTGTAALTAPNGVTVNPASSGNFVQGVWTGSLMIPQRATNLVLQANDGAGHTGFASSINIVAIPSLALAQSGNSLLLFWPVDPTGFSLEYSTNLFPPQWAPVTSPPLQVGNQWLESVQIGYTNQTYLYRLRYTLP